MKKKILVGGVLVVVGLTPISALADPIARLRLVSEIGDFIGQGQTVDLTYG